MTHVSTVCDDCGTPDPTDNLWTYVEGIDLRVELPPDLTLHAQAPAEFLFHVDPDSTGPNGEVPWEIWRQWDLSGPGSDEAPGDRKRTTWGVIKAMYM
jgi:hypothetical protein